MLKERAAAGKPVRIGQIGAGKFGTMFLSQVRLTTGMHLMGLADLMPQRARERMMEVGWPKEQTEAKSMADALKTGKTFVTEDAMAVIAHPDIEVVIEATGDPGTGIKLCQAAIAHGKHVVMVNVEADALAGPLLARRREGGRRRLFAGLGRPAGADLRARRLGAHLRITRSSPPARARAITRPTTSPRPTRCGTSSTRTW